MKHPADSHLLSRVSIVNAPREVRLEAEWCAWEILQEVVGTGSAFSPLWRDQAIAWYLCERHGGRPFLMPLPDTRLIAFCTGEDIWVNVHAAIREILDALPEELAHRLSVASPRFERLNRHLHAAHQCDRRVFLELVAQRFSALFTGHTTGKYGRKERTETKF